MKGAGGRRVLAVAVVAVVLLLGIAWWLVRALGEPHAQVVAGAPSGWQTIEYEGVRVDIPRTWERTDMDDCEFRFEHWGEPGPAPCGRGGGVAFYASATFDPAHGPGVRRARANVADGPAWEGWVDTGEYAVYVATGQRGTVTSILRSVTGPG